MQHILFLSIWSFAPFFRIVFTYWTEQKVNSILESFPGEYEVIEQSCYAYKKRIC